MSDIEISEADEAIADRLSGVDYRKFPGDRDRNAEIIAEVRLTATAAAEARVTEAVKAERERIKTILEAYRKQAGRHDYLMDRAFENAITLIEPSRTAPQAGEAS